MKYAFPKGSTSVIVPVFIEDSSSTTGAGLGSLDQTSSIAGGYLRPGGLGVALAVDENVTTEGTYEAPTTAAKIRIGTPANMRTGDYELHLHNDLLATGADVVYVSLGGASNMAEMRIEIQLTSVNLNDATRGGMTALPNADADAGGGLPISDAGGLDLDTILDVAVSTRLAPTTAGRALDVTTTGAAGIDWANIENPTTAVDLSATDIQLCDTTTTNTDMVGTDNAALASVCTEGRLAELDAANLPADVAAIPTTAMRGTDSAALATVCTEGRLAELDAANLPADVDAILLDTGTTLPGLIAALNDLAASDILTTALTESYAADGAAPTLSQLVYMLWSRIHEFGIASTTLTSKKLDSTAAMTWTLDSSTLPTSSTRAT